MSPLEFVSFVSMTGVMKETSSAPRILLSLVEVATDFRVNFHPRTSLHFGLVVTTVVTSGGGGS